MVTRPKDTAAYPSPREEIYEESICVALHLLDNERVDEARDELLGALPYRLTKTYSERAAQWTLTAKPRLPRLSQPQRITRREIEAVRYATEELRSYYETVGEEACLDDEEMPTGLIPDVLGRLDRFLARVEAAEMVNG